MAQTATSSAKSLHAGPSPKPTVRPGAPILADLDDAEVPGTGTWPHVPGHELGGCAPVTAKGAAAYLE
jgi:hypothetical protein